jgi:serine/threonine-protein kinase
MKVLNGCYEIKRELGSGGMGTVYLAEHLKDHSFFAVKRINLAQCLEGIDKAKARLTNEAKEILRLRSDHIVKGYTFGEGNCNGEKWDYIAMEYVDGWSLDRVLHHGPWGFDDPRRFLCVLRDVASALDVCHHAYVIHRDVKPSNIMIRKADNVAKLTDFGIAKNISSLTRPELTRTGVLVGTVPYLAPEVIKEDPPKYTKYSDQWSLGVIAYFVLVGTMPFMSESQVNLMYNITQDHRAQNEGFQLLPDTVKSVLDKVLHPVPHERYEDCKSFVEDLSAACQANFEWETRFAGSSLLTSQTVVHSEPASGFRRADDGLGDRQPTRVSEIVRMGLSARIRSFLPPTNTKTWKQREMERLMRDKNRH